MKIIRPGRLAPDVMRGTCGHCGCEVECHPSEVKHVYHDYDGSTYRWVTCPLCSRNLDVRPAHSSTPS